MNGIITETPMGYTNRVCPICRHGETTNTHDVESWNIYEGENRIGHKFKCPNCNHIWDELY